MKKSALNIRLMQYDDFDAVVAIDSKILKSTRTQYYEMKFEQLFKSGEYLPTSLVAEADGTVVGFIIGQLFMGEFGIFQQEASLDTIGVDPEYQQKGVGEQLVEEFMGHLKELGVKRVNTMVDRNDSKLLRFFNANHFSPSVAMISLERIV
jgi:ribosomal protein S18 acetylase RimI-like enzyme